ncbi:hypothetical protein P279_28240 [Rhodobacteraceae bacterium PD-2]|nr:hypothetical protein P279_28240 [Rhodobacteraceae bacterium PD-2]
MAVDFRFLWNLRGSDGVTPPGGIDAPWQDRNNPYWVAAMSEFITAGLDLAKNVSQVHGTAA